MWRLIHALVDVALHRRGPADLPASQAVLTLTLVADLVIGLTALQRQFPLQRAANLLAFDTALYLGTIWLVLRLFERRRHFLQTATAFVGTAALLNAVALSLLLWDEALESPPTQLSTPQTLLLLLLLWNVDIGGYILSKALAKPYVLGVSIMIVYVLTSTALREALFPVAA